MSKAKAIVGVLEAIVDAIKAKGSAGLPSGHLYAMLMNHLDLDTYQKLEAALVTSGKIRKSGDLLIAV